MRPFRALWLFAGLGGCSLLYSDPLGTGVRVSPPPGEYVGEQRLIIQNDTDDTLLCVVFETDVCPSLGAAVAGLGEIAPGEQWEVEAVDCIAGDFVCRSPDTPEDELPLRGWTWSITPSTEDE